MLYGLGLVPGKAPRERDGEDVMSALNISHLVKYSMNTEGLGQMSPQNKGSSFWATFCQFIGLEVSLSGLCCYRSWSGGCPGSWLDSPVG